MARVERVVAAAVPVLQVDAVGLTLLDDTDRPRVAAASDEQAALVELAMRVNAQAGAAGDRQHRLQQQLDLTPTDTLTEEEKP